MLLFIIIFLTTHFNKPTCTCMHQSTRTYFAYNFNAFFILLQLLLVTNNVFIITITNCEMEWNESFERNSTTLSLWIGKCRSSFLPFKPFLQTYLSMWSSERLCLCIFYIINVLDNLTPRIWFKTNPIRFCGRSEFNG